MVTKARFQRSVRWVCFALLLTAVVFRLADGWSFAQSPEVLSQAQTELPESIPAESTYAPLYYSLPERETATFSPADGALVSVDNRCNAEFDQEALLLTPLDIKMSESEPLVLIIHTHATEAYTPTADTGYEQTSDYRTADTNYNVVRVGQTIADCLNALGIVTLHDTTLNDQPGYNDAYRRTGEVIARYLEAYPSIQMVIDVHRDAVSDGAGGEVALRCELDGQPAAKLMLVMGTDQGGLSHPNWRGNLSAALKLQTLAEKEAPGVFRELSVCASRFNEHMTPYSMLLEVGSAGNTLEEALRSGEFFARQLAHMLLTCAED